MSIYELEERIYFDGALPVDIGEAGETPEQETDNSNQSETDCNNSEDVPTVPEDSNDGSDNNSDSTDDLSDLQLSTNSEEVSTDSIVEIINAIDDTIFSDISPIEKNILIISTDNINFDEIADSVNDGTILITYDSDDTFDSIIQKLNDELGDIKVMDIGIIDSDISEQLKVNSKECIDFLSDLKELKNFDSEINLFDMSETVNSKIASTEFNSFILSTDNDGVWDLVEESDTDFLTDYFNSDFSLLTINKDLSAEVLAKEEVVFINSSVMDADEIIDDLPENTEIVYLDAGEDAIQQITDYLADKTDIDTIRIISHGNEGYFVLNGQIIDSDYVTENADIFYQWRNSLSENADIMLYGCNLAASTEGQELVQYIASYTDADVAASIDDTGGNGGNWNLEYHQGIIEAGTISVAGYDYHLTSYVVNLNTDNDPGGGGEGSGTSGDFRYCITQSIQNPDWDGNEIIFNLAVGNETITIGSQLPTITESMTIDGDNSSGSGVDVTVKVTTPGTSEYRVFYINASDKTVVIENMTIKGGDISSFIVEPAAANYGGGIYIAAGTVVLDTVTVSDSIAFRGGGIYNNTGSTMSIISSTISGNSIPQGGNSYFHFGGGIYNDGTMTITSSTITENIVSPGAPVDPEEAYGYGGGIYNDTGTLTITSSIVSNNTAEYYLSGGTIYSCGGGIYNNTGSLTITSSTIIGNAANSAGGGDEGGDGGGIYNNTGSLTVTSSTVVGNLALGNGGGISNEGTASITSSTVSGNITYQLGGGINNNGTFIITSSTITGNTGYYDDPMLACSGINNGGSLYLLNTIVAGNYGVYDLNSMMGMAVYSYYSWIDNYFLFNFDADVANKFDDYTWNDVYGLADYGGDTLTMLVGKTGSPALDAGTLTGIDISDNVCWYNQSDSIWYTYNNVATTIQTINATDQRGQDRPDTTTAATTTIGATQYVIADSTYVDYVNNTDWTVVTTEADSLDVTDGHVSIRKALTFAASTSEITFSDGISECSTDHMLPIIGRTLTIDGGSDVTISGDTDSDDSPNTVTGLLQVTSAGNLTVENITITKGKSYFGGGIYNAGTLAVASSTISSNTVTSSGGGIYNAGTATINASTISENNTTADLDGGAGIYNNTDSTMTITSSTISGNTANWHYGGILNKGTLSITGSTISGNTNLNVADGCGICNDSNLYITNSIIAYNYSSLGMGDEYDDIKNSGTIYGNYNISSYTVWGSGTGNTTYTYDPSTGYGDTLFASYTDPIEGNTYIHKPVLALNAPGTTMTVALAAGSIASGTGAVTGTYEDSGTKYAFKAYGTDIWYSVEDGSDVTAFSPSPLTTDQRGTTITGTPSIGAYFLASTPSTLYYMAHTLSGSNWADLAVWKTSISYSTDPLDYGADATEAPDASNSSGIIIYDGITVTVTAASVDLSIDQTTINSTASITIDDGVTLTIANGTEDVDLDAEGSIVVNAAAGTLLIASGASVDSEGTFTVNGVLSFDDSSDNDGILNLAGSSITIASLTAGSGTITYDGAGQTIAGVTYNALQLSGSGTTKTATGTLQADSLTVDLGVTLEAENLTVNTTFTNNGTTQTSGITVSLPDAAVGGTFVYAGPGGQQIDNLNGNAYNILQLSNPGSKTATGTLQANTLTVDNGIMFEVENLTVNTTFTNAGETHASGTVSLPDAAVDGIFAYNGIGQTIDNLGGYAYSELQLTGSGTNTATGILQAGTLRVDPLVTLNVVNLTVNTNFQNNGTTQASGAVSLPDAPVTGTFVYDGENQTIDNLGGIGEYETLQLSGSGTKTASDTLQAQNLTVGLGVTLDAVDMTVNIAFTNTGTTQASGTVSLPDAAVTGTFTYNGEDQTVDNLGGYAYSTLKLSGTGTVTIDTGTTDVNTAFIVIGTYTDNTITNNGTLTLSGTADFGSVTIISGTVTYDGGTQNIAGATYYNLDISGNGNKTLEASTTVGGNLTVDSDTNLQGTQTLGVTGNATISGAIGSTTALSSFSIGGIASLGADITTTGTQSYTGEVTLTAGATLKANSGNSASSVTFTGNVKGGYAINIGSGTEAANVTNAVFSSTVGGTTALSSLTVTGTSSIGGNVTTTGNQTYTGAITAPSSVTLNAGSGDITATNVSNNFSTVTLTGHDVSLKDANALGLGTSTLSGDLTLQSGGVLTQNGNLAVNGTIDITSGGLTVSSGIFNTENSGGTWDINGNVSIASEAALNATTGTFNVSGNWTNAGTFNHKDGTVTFNGSTAQTIISGGSSFYNVILNNTITSGISIELSDDMTIAHNLTLTDGIIDVNNYTLTVGGSIYGATGETSVGDFDSGHMIVVNGTGYMQRTVSEIVSYLFPIGTYSESEGYKFSPITVEFTDSTFAAGAYLEVTAAPEKYEHNPCTTNYLERYWNATSGGVSGFSATVTCYYDQNDVVGTENSICGAEYLSGSWVKPTLVNTANHTFTLSAVTSLAVFSGIAASYTNSVTVTPSTSQTVTAGDTLQFSASAYDQNGNLITDTATDFIWSNTNTSGLFNTTTAGTYTVNASYDGVSSDNVSVIVQTGSVSVVDISPSPAQRITAGDTVQFTASAYDAYDNLITSTATDFTWSNTTSAGLFNTTATGTYTVNATYSQISSVNVSVTVTAIPSPTPSPTRPDINNGGMINDGTQINTLTSWRNSIDNGSENSIDSRDAFEPNEVEGIGLMMDNLNAFAISSESIANGEYSMGAGVVDSGNSYDGEYSISSPSLSSMVNGEYGANLNSLDRASENQKQEFNSQYNGIIDLSFDLERIDSIIDFQNITFYNERHQLFKTELDLLLEKI